MRPPRRQEVPPGGDARAGEGGGAGVLRGGEGDLPPPQPVLRHQRAPQLQRQADEAEASEVFQASAGGYVQTPGLNHVTWSLVITKQLYALPSVSYLLYHKLI